MKNKFPAAIVFAVLLFSLTLKAQIASGGAYTLEQTVVASGGGESDGGIYKTEGTSGQSAAGVLLTNAPYALLGGFWTPTQFAPTAANVSLNGQVVSPNGVGIKGAIITLTGGLLTAPRVTRTNNFGHFAFSGVESGHLYVVTVAHPKYGFAQNSQTLMLFDDRKDVVFRADWEN